MGYDFDDLDENEALYDAADTAERACRAREAAMAAQDQLARARAPQAQREALPPPARQVGAPARAVPGAGGVPAAVQRAGTSGDVADGDSCSQRSADAAAAAAALSGPPAPSAHPSPTTQRLLESGAAQSARSRAESPRKRPGGGAGASGSRVKRGRASDIKAEAPAPAGRSHGDFFKTIAANADRAVARGAKGMASAATRMGTGKSAGEAGEVVGKRPFSTRDGTQRMAKTGPVMCFEQVAGDSQVLQTMEMCLHTPCAILNGRHSGTQCMQRKRAYFINFANDRYDSQQNFNEEVCGFMPLRDSELPHYFETFIIENLDGRPLPRWFVDKPGQRKGGCLPLNCAATKLMDNTTLGKINELLPTAKYDEGHPQAGQRKHPRDIMIVHGKTKMPALNLIKRFDLVPVPTGGSTSKNAWKVRNLLPSELDTLFGFDGHLRDLNQTVARKLVGRTWLVDQAMYALSPLRRMTDDDWVERGYATGSTDKGLIVWSLFDGIGAGPFALQRLGVRVAKLFTSEIDADAIRHVRSRHTQEISATQPSQAGDDAALPTCEFYDLGSITGANWLRDGVEERIKQHGRPHIILAGARAAPARAAERERAGAAKSERVRGVCALLLCADPPLIDPSPTVHRPAPALYCAAGGRPAVQPDLLAKSPARLEGGGPLRPRGHGVQARLPRL